MSEPEPQDPALWAAKILALKHAVPFQAFTVVTAGGTRAPVTRPEFVRLTDPETCADVIVPGRGRTWLALEWVTDIEIGGEVGAPPRPPRYVAKLRALQKDGPFGPLVLTMKDGRRFPLAGPHEFLVAPDGRSVAVCEEERGLEVLATSEITDLAPAT
jgi:hypothetical protein